MSTISEAYAAAVESFHAGDLQRAERICRQINQVAPEYADAWYFRGLINYSLGESAKAIDYLRRAVALNPDDEEAHNNLGVILCDLGQLDEAIASLQRAVELRPDYPAAHNNLGVATKAYGDVDRAVECYRRALQLAPDYGEAHLNLGGVLIAQGKLDEAADCYRQVMRIDPGNSVAAHMLAACAGGTVPDRASDQYVRNTFDRFAGRFNQALQRLNYQAPRLVIEALAREIPAPSRALDILDAGCGTGLCGPLLRPYANHLVGIDLSPGMLRQAARTDAYDALKEAELVGFMSERDRAFDAIISADTLVYFGQLEQALAAAANALRPQGCLIFTLERAASGADDAGFALQSSGRYRHSQMYVERTLQQTGFVCRRIDVETLRQERSQSVAGLVITAIRCGHR